MADEQIMKEIRDLQDGVAEYAMVAFGESASLDRLDPAASRAGLTSFCRALAGQWRALADLWTRSKRRGWQGEATMLRKHADAVERVAKDLDALGAEPASPRREPLAPPFGEPVDVAKLDELVAGRATMTATVAAIDDAVAAGASAPWESGERDRMATELAEETMNDRKALHDYLSGAVDQLPDWPGRDADPKPGAFAELPVGNMLQVHADAERATVEGDALTAPTVLTADPFSDPAPYAPAPRTPDGGRKVTFLELLTPPDAATLERRAALFDHWSFSQLEAFEDCGARYRMQRVEQVAQVPQWALVGGNAFHAAVAEVELDMTQPVTWPDDAALGVVWNRVFHTEIAKVAADAGGMPMDQWRASKQGKEGYDFWRVEGERMLVMYVDQRRRLVEAAERVGATPRKLWTVPDTPHSSEPALAVELPFSFTVRGPMGELRVDGILDQAWMADGNMLVHDLKSGSKMPDDTFQLGVEAWGVVARVTPPELFAADPRAAAELLPGRIIGAFYDARKGIYTTPVDLLEAHPWDEVVYRFHAAEAGRRAAAYTPRRSSFCGGCSVRYACPVGGR